MALFEFEFFPIEEVPHFGKDEDKTLHWYGLTYGIFHLDVNGKKLFQNSDEILEYWKNEEPQYKYYDYIDYQIARLYEDTLSILPYILQPISDKLLEIIKPIEFLNSIKKIQNIINSSKYIYDESLEEYYIFNDFFNLRSLDSSYLVQSPNIYFIRDGDNIIIRWDNRDKIIDGYKVWSEELGKYQMAVTEFTREVESFHNRLMDGMEERVKSIVKNNPFKDVYIDIDSLIIKHEERKKFLKEKLEYKPIIPDWKEILSLYKKIKQEL